MTTCSSHIAKEATIAVISPRKKGGRGHLNDKTASMRRQLLERWALLYQLRPE
jgi:hypothetical protein